MFHSLNLAYDDGVVDADGWVVACPVAPTAGIPAEAFPSMTTETLRAQLAVLKNLDSINDVDVLRAIFRGVIEVIAEHACAVSQRLRQRRM